MSAINSQNLERKPREILIAVLISALGLAYFCFWIFHFYPTLINDEYAAMNFVARVLKSGLYPTPHRVFKPYSLMLALLTGGKSPLVFEAIAAACAGLLLLVFFLCVRCRLEFRFAILATLMLALTPDLFDDVLVGNTTVLGIFFLMLGIHLTPQLLAQPRRWKRYSLLGFLGELTRPESFLLAVPLAWWLFPKNRREIPRWMLAPGLIGLGVLIWFAKDWFLNHDIFYAMKIARYDATIGFGPPRLGPVHAWTMSHYFLARDLSRPFEVLGFLGLLLFGWDHRKTAFREPLLVIPILVFAFFYFSFWHGLYPQLRYFIYIEPFLLFYAAWLFSRIYRFLQAKNLAWLGIVLVIGFSVYYFLWAGRQFIGKELKAISTESKLQRGTIELSDYFRPLLKTQEKPFRILISDRRDDQFSWLLRDLPLQDYLYFQEVYYRTTIEKKGLFDGDPDFIVWAPHDFQYNPVDDMFQWLTFQDRTELDNHSISLAATVGPYRVFRVSKLPGTNP